FLFLYVFFSSCFCHPLDLHSFPTRRSSDLLPRSGISVDADSFCPRGCRYRRQCRVSRAPRSRAISEPHRCHHFVCDGASGLPVLAQALARVALLPAKSPRFLDPNKRGRAAKPSVAPFVMRQPPFRNERENQKGNLFFLVGGDERRSPSVVVLLDAVVLSGCC